MSEIINAKVLQARCEAAWDTAINKHPEQWRVKPMQGFEESHSKGKVSVHSTKQGLLGTEENNLHFFDKSVRVMAEIALYQGFEGYVKHYLPHKHPKIIPHWALHHDSTVRGHYLEELQDHVFSAITHHMGAGYVFINSGYLEWLGGASAFNLYLNPCYYALIDSPYVQGVIADPYPILFSIKHMAPQVTLSQKGGISLHYHINFYHDSLNNVLIMRDEIQANWRFQND